MTRRLLIGVWCLVAGTAVVAAQSGYVPHRVYVSSDKRFGDLESMLADLVRADVVFVGEEHNDPETHRLELAMLEGLGRRRGDVILALEMFERDVQGPIDQFVAGRMSEPDFLRQSRPWPTYGTDYKPLVDFAAARKWSVVGADVPRGIAADVAKSGFDALKNRPDSEQAWYAHDLKCPTDDAYFKRFRAAMGGHDGTTPDIGRYYDSQCLKDETMGESIARAYAAGASGGKRPLIVSVNGAFHSDYRDGTVERTHRRMPGKRIVVITIEPVKDLDAVKPDGDDRKRADYNVYTLAKN